MRAHLIIDLQSGAVELHTDTSPKPVKAVRGKDKKKRKKAKSPRLATKAVKVGTSVTAIKRGGLMSK